MSEQNGYDNQYNNEDYAFQTVMRNGRPKTLGWSLASLLVGVVSVVCCCLGWSGLILGALSVVLAIVSRRQLGYFDGMAIAGLVLGIFGAVFGVCIIVVPYMIPEEIKQQFWEEYQKALEEASKQQ